MKTASPTSSSLDVSVGSIAWGESTKGVLNEIERGQLLSNFRFIVDQERLDADRRRLGLLNPKFICVEELSPPDTRMVKEALAHVSEIYWPTLLRHCWRTYYFGSLISLHEGVEFDKELAFAASMLHDLGLTSSANPQPCDCCFAVSGGVDARDFLLSRGFSRDHANIVGHAVSVHLNYHVPYEEHGATAFLVTRGAICDVFGTGVSRMSEESVKQVLSKYSRDELYTVFNDTAFKHLTGTRFEVSFKALAEGETDIFAHPLDLAPFK